MQGLTQRLKAMTRTEIIEEAKRLGIDVEKYVHPSALNTQAGGTHYKDCAIQPIQYIHANGLDFFQGNIVKYATRHKSKNGAEDLRKVIHYAQLALELQYGIKPTDELADMTRAGLQRDSARGLGIPGGGNRG